MLKSAWPSHSWICFIGTPLESIMLAQEWRKSWNLIFLKLFLRKILIKFFVNLLGESIFQDYQHKHSLNIGYHNYYKNWQDPRTWTGDRKVEKHNCRKRRWRIFRVEKTKRKAEKRFWDVRKMGYEIKTHSPFFIFLLGNLLGRHYFL